MKGVGVVPIPFFIQLKMIRNKKITSYTPVENWALTLVEAKRHLNILDDSFDDLINDYLASAHVWLYNETAILIKGEVLGYMQEWDDFRVDVAKVDTLAIYYYDLDNTRTLLSSSNYYWNNGLYSYIELKGNLPSLYVKDFAIEIEITTLANTDPMVKQALRMLVADMFENRQNEILGSTGRIISRGTMYQLSLVSQRTEL
jgi:hypothetical protein